MPSLIREYITMNDHESKISTYKVSKEPIYKQQIFISLLKLIIIGIIIDVVIMHFNILYFIVTGSNIIFNDFSASDNYLSCIQKQLNEYILNRIVIIILLFIVTVLILKYFRKLSSFAPVFLFLGILMIEMMSINSLRKIKKDEELSLFVHIILLGLFITKLVIIYKIVDNMSRLLSIIVNGDMNSSYLMKSIIDN